MVAGRPVLLYTTPDPKTEFDIWAAPLDGDRKPFPIVQTPFHERLAQFSPDGRWIAYESNESGRYEIYVQSFSGSGGTMGRKIPISTAGGAQVRWRPDGNALFYIALDNRLTTVPVRVAADGQTVEPGVPVPLFAARVVGGALQPFPRHLYDVSRDGRRFLMLVEREHPPAPITVLVNWTGQP